MSVGSSGAIAALLKGVKLQHSAYDVGDFAAQGDTLRQEFGQSRGLVCVTRLLSFEGRCVALRTCWYNLALPT